MSPNLVQRLSSEALGTLLVVYSGVAATLAATGGSLGAAAAYAVALALAVWIFGATSGTHLNPAVTLAVAVRARFAWRDVPGYLIAQVVGGVLAGLLAWATYGAAGARGGLGTTVINPSATTVTALAVEALVAFVWVLAYYALFVDDPPGAASRHPSNADFSNWSEHVRRGHGRSRGIRGCLGSRPASPPTPPTMAPACSGGTVAAMVACTAPLATPRHPARPNRAGVATGRAGWKARISPMAAAPVKQARSRGTGSWRWHSQQPNGRAAARVRHPAVPRTARSVLK